MLNRSPICIADRRRVLREAELCRERFLPWLPCEAEAYRMNCRTNEVQLSAPTPRALCYTFGQEILLESLQNHASVNLSV